jgi:hypothetical protein
MHGHMNIKLIQALLGSVANACISFRLYYTVLLITSIHYFRTKTQHSFLPIKTNMLQVQSTVVIWTVWVEGWSALLRIRTTERKLRAVRKIQKS